MEHVSKNKIHVVSSTRGRMETSGRGGNEGVPEPWYKLIQKLSPQPTPGSTDEWGWAAAMYAGNDYVGLFVSKI